MKKLLYIPIIHNMADMGSLGSQLSREGEKKYGAAHWNHHLGQVNKAWDMIESEIFRHVLDKEAEKLVIYQDGLPVAGETGMKIIKDTAEKGSKNYDIIARLLDIGAKLEIAENKELLFREYHLLSDISKAESSEKQLEAFFTYQEVSQQLLNERDNHIASQINSTLRDGETGIAFFGASHSIIDKLNKQIEVVVINMFNDVISLNLFNQASSIKTERHYSLS
jgi:hypothetical protein